MAAYFRLPSALRILVEHVADPENKDGFGKTPFSWAAERGQENVVALLLAYNK